LKLTSPVALESLLNGTWSSGGQQIAWYAE